MSGPQPAGWHARLALRYAAADGRTVLRHKAHAGPLAVQKSLYPEGPRVCHTLLLHPPGGIAGGDTLDIALDLAAGSEVLATTPGAGKWYRSSGAEGVQQVRVAIAAGALLEWLPQENIVFNGARARMHARIELARGARYLGWDVVCLGRTASGERYTHGTLKQKVELIHAGRLLWSERSRVAGGSSALTSPVALAGAPVSAVMLAAGRTVPPEILAECRALRVDGSARAGITVVDGVLVARHLGPCSEQARHYLIALWRLLRPVFAGRAAAVPRIWNT